MQLGPVVDSAPGQHLRKERGSRGCTCWGRGGFQLRGWGVVPDLGAPPKRPRACPHQRDLGPGARRGAVEGRTRGGRRFVGQERPPAGERRERGGRRQPGSHQGPDSRHGRAGTAGSHGHTAETARAGLARSRLRSHSVPAPLPLAPAGGVAPAQSPPRPASRAALPGAPAKSRPPTPRPSYSQLRRGLRLARSASPGPAQGAAGQATALKESADNCPLIRKTAKSRRSDVRAA